MATLVLLSHQLRWQKTEKMRDFLRDWLVPSADRENTSFEKLLSFCHVCEDMGRHWSSNYFLIMVPPGGSGSSPDPVTILDITINFKKPLAPKSSLVTTRQASADDMHDMF